MSDEALAAALSGRPEYTVKKYIQLVEALRDKAAALTSSSGQRRKEATPGAHSLQRMSLLLSWEFGWITLTFCWFTSSIICCVHASLP